MKKFGKLVLVAVLALSVFAGCGDKEKASKKEDTLTIAVVKHPLTKPMKEMQWAKELEKRAGVKIKWEEISADWEQKKSPMLASGEIPDLMIGGNVVTDAEFSQYPGLFEDLSQHLDSLPNVEKMFKEKYQTEAMATQSEGQIYGLPRYQRFWPRSASRQYINKQWLDNLGLKEPTNWDELYDVLLAFKNEDANGNGDKKDEIAMDWAPVGTGGFGYFQVTQLLASTGMTVSEGGNQGYFLEDGKVKSFFTDERYKELIQFLNKCWQAGLINAEVFTQDYTAYQSKGRGDGKDATVGFSWGWEVSDRFGNELAAQYLSMAPLKVSGDSSIEPSWSYEEGLNYFPNMITMSANTKNKEAALKFINGAYDTEISMQILFGDLGTNIEELGEGKYKILPPADSAMDPGTWKWTSTVADNGPIYISDDLDLELGEDMKAVVEQTKAIDPALDRIKVAKEVLPTLFIKYSNEDNSTMAINNTEMLSVGMTNFGQWITEGGIDKEWDAYLATISKTGLNENLEIMQTYFDEYAKK